jgi:hypothetical protein
MTGIIFEGKSKEIIGKHMKPDKSILDINANKEQ